MDSFIHLSTDDTGCLLSGRHFPGQHWGRHTRSLLNLPDFPKHIWEHGSKSAWDIGALLTADRLLKRILWEVCSLIIIHLNPAISARLPSLCILSTYSSSMNFLVGTSVSFTRKAQKTWAWPGTGLTRLHHSLACELAQVLSPIWASIPSFIKGYHLLNRF